MGRGEEEKDHHGLNKQKIKISGKTGREGPAGQGLALKNTTQEGPKRGQNAIFGHGKHAFSGIR